MTQKKQTQNRVDNKTKQKTKRKRDWSFYVIIICSVIIAIPLLFLGYVGISASQNSGKPINGDRFLNDLDPAIEQTQIDTIVENLKAIEGVEGVFSELKTATLRVYLYAPNIDETTGADLVSSAYETVSQTLDPSVYFTIQDIKKQYDLEIYAYNQNEVTDETKDAYVNVLLWKGSNMTEPSKQVLSQPVSQEIVDYFEKIQKENDEAKANADTESTDTGTQEDTNNSENGE